MKKKKVLVFPKDRNPYQDLLYSGKLTKECEITYFALDTLSFPPFTPHSVRLLATAVYYRIKGYTIYHLHWVYPFVIKHLGLLGRIISTIEFLGFHFWLKLLGIKIVYTVHNIKPHEKVFVYDLQVMKLFSAMVDEHIVHSKKTITDLTNVGIQVKKYTVMPMGSYEGFYKTVTKEKAKQELNIPQKNTVVTFVGIIRPYKGIDTVMAVFEKLVKEHKNITCIIAGESLDPQLKQDLEDMNNKNMQNLIVLNRSISKDELGIIMSASDLFLYPVKNITSSSTILLTTTYGVPIIAPRKGELIEMPENIGYWVQEDSFETYYTTVVHALKNTDQREQISQQARAYAEKHPWSASQQILLDCYGTL